MIVYDYMMDKVLDKIKMIIGIEKFHDTKTLIETDIKNAMSWKIHAGLCKEIYLIALGFILKYWILQIVDLVVQYYIVKPLKSV